MLLLTQACAWSHLNLRTNATKFNDYEYIRRDVISDFAKTV